MNNAISLKNPGASLVFPRDGGFRSTHLGIGAHADDLEIMAYHGIAECYEGEEVFSGITVTNGVGSPQNEEEKLDIEELRVARQKEQAVAADMGRYGFMAQLDYASSKVKAEDHSQVVDEIYDLLIKAKPRVVYLHQPGDKHPTHIAVLRASMEALQKMELADRPEEVYGCEVWRDLDWLPDDQKVYLPTGKYPELAEEIISVFQSQISAGVAYDKGTIGRRLANGTFADPHVVRQGDFFTLAMDLMPVVCGEVSLRNMVLCHVARFSDHVNSLWSLPVDL